MARQNRYVSGAENIPASTSAQPKQRGNARHRSRPPGKTDSAAASEAVKKHTKAKLVRTPAKPKSESVDVEMGTVQLPRPEQGDDEVPLQYAIDVLARNRASLMYTQAHTRCESGSMCAQSLPESVDLTISVDNAVYMPSHTLAVYTAASVSTPTAPSTRSDSFPAREFVNSKQRDCQPHTRVQLYPVHAPVLTTACTKLPADVFPPSEVAPAYSQQLTTPVVPFAVSHADAFKHVFAYLYHHSPAHLLAALLPTSTPNAPTRATLDPSALILEDAEPTPAELEAAAEKRRAYAVALAQTYSTTALLRDTDMLTGVWRNVQQLGIWDAGMWCAMDTAWDVLFRALVLKGHIKPPVPQVPSPASTPSE